MAINLGDDPAVGGILVNARDVTDRHRAERIAAAQAGILELVARGASIGGVLDDIIEMVEHWIPGSSAVLALVDNEDGLLHVASAPSIDAEVRSAIDGFPAAGLDGVYPDDVIVTEVRVNEATRSPASGSWRAAFAPGGRDRSTTLKAAGGSVPSSCSGPTTRPPAPSERTLLASAANLAAVAIARDRAQNLLAHQASHDALTGLPNRQLVLDRLRRITGHPRRGGPNTAVLFLDIDRFKVLNDSVGHDAGDALLVEMGARLRVALRPATSSRASAATSS